MGLFKRKVRRSNRTNKEGFNGDIWTQALAEWGDRLPKNVIVFGELVGFVPGTTTPIQKGHTYNVRPGSFELYVYRVAIITEDAELYDLTWDQVRDFCSRHGLKHVPELDRMPKVVFDIETYNELDFAAVQHDSKMKFDNRQAYTDEPVPLSEGGTGKDEGIAIRVERGLTPEIWKFKNKSHYLYESDQLGSGEDDLEQLKYETLREIGKQGNLVIVPEDFSGMINLK